MKIERCSDIKTQKATQTTSIITQYMMINKFIYHNHFGVFNAMIIHVHMYLCQISLLLILKLYGIVQCFGMKISDIMYNLYMFYILIIIMCNIQCTCTCTLYNLQYMYF